MDFGPKTYLILYAAIVTPILISFFFLRKGSPPPVKLNLKESDGRGESSAKAAGGKNLPSEASQSAASASSASGSAAGSAPGTATTAETALNVLFQWNGHAWDAYEVLGIPAGSSREAVNTAFQQQVEGADPDSQQFFKAAHEAIIRSQFTRG